MAGFTPGRTGFSRVFLIEGRARGDHEPDYQSCLKAGSPSQDFGDVENIECPSPDQYNHFEVVGEIQSAISRATLPLSGRYAFDLASELLRLAKARCAVDVHVHMGECTDPTDFNTFTKALIFENSMLTNWSAEDLGALGSDEAAKVDESSDVTGRNMYEVLQLTLAERGGDVVVNPRVDVVICDVPSCGECEVESDGCQKIYTTGASTPGSPGTAPDLDYSLDKGENWAADDINSLQFDEDASALACLSSYVVVVSNDSASLHYKLQADIDAGVLAGWTEEVAGFVPGGEPNDIWSVGNWAFIVGDGGYIYGTSDPTAGVTVLDAGVAVLENFNAVHALDEDFAVAVGNNNEVAYTENQALWQALVGPEPGAALLCVWVKSETEWWVGTDSGSLWYSLDQATTWVEKALPGVGYDDITDIAFATDSIANLSALVTGPAGRILRSYSGGHSWIILPEGVGVIPANDTIAAIAACRHDPNFIVGVGTAENAADGIIIVGQD